MTRSERDIVPQRATGSTAIIGMAGRFPGAPDVDALWTVLQGDRPVTGPVPEDRPDILPWAARWDISAGFLSEIDRFDAGFFNIAPKDAHAMDPQQRILLEVVWQAIENAGLTPETLPRETGVFVGVISGDYGTFAEELALEGAVPLRGTDHYQVANRISYHFDLTGPSMAIDTACSGSGVAIHQAIGALKAGDCPVAIVAGVNLFLHASRFAQFRQLGIISPDNCCRPFRDGANGTVYGEGVAAMVLRSVEDAEVEGDNIRACICGSAVTSGGRTQGFTVPSAGAQRRALGMALARAGDHGQGIGYVEAHGTGTKLGDPIEVRGLTEAFAAHPDASAGEKTILGSIKGHIGHLESAAAMAGVAKIVLQMEHDRLGPSLPASKANPLINFGKTPFALAGDSSEWPADDKTRPRRAMLSSFGAGGVNACLVLESAPLSVDVARAPCPGLFPFSARDPEALQRMAQVWHNWLGEAGKTVSLARLATTLQTGRVVFDHRFAVLAGDVETLRAGLAGILSGKGSKAQVFSGQRLAGLATAFNAAGVGTHTVQGLLQQADQDGVLPQLAALWVNGVDIDWAQGVARRLLPRPVAAPGYPFRGDRYWLPKPADKSVAPQTEDPSDPVAGFPGRHITLADGSHIFALRRDETAIPSLIHHRIFDEVVVPGSFFVSLAATAARSVLGDYGFDLVEGLFREGLVLLPKTAREIQCRVSAPDDTTQGRRRVEISSRTDDDDGAPWVQHFEVSLEPDCRTSMTSLEGLGTDTETEPAGAFYAHGLELGFGWHGPFRALSDITRNATGAEAQVADIGAFGQETPGAIAHPATLDAIFQVALAALPTGASREGEAFMPLGLHRFRVHGQVEGPVQVRFVTRTAPGAQSERFDGRVIGKDGRPVIEIEGLTVLRVCAANLRALRERSVGQTLESARQGAALDMLKPDWVDVSAPDTAAGDGLAILPHGDLSALEPLLALETVTAVAADQAVMPEHLCLVHAAQQSDQTAADLARTAAEIAETLRRLTSGHPETRLRCWLVGHEGLGQGALEGFWHSLRWEMPALRPASVLVAGKTTARDPVQVLAALIRADPEEDCWRIDGDRVQVARLQPASAAEDLPRITGQRCIVTGGAGGLGALHVDWLLQQGAAQVVVVGRSPAPQNDAVPAGLVTLATRYGPDRLIYRAADMADRAALRGALSGLPDFGGGLALAMHCAGTSGECGLLTLGEDALRQALDAKLDGFRNFVEAIGAIAPARIIALSSATGLLGAPGQTAYAMANAGLEALCDAMRRTGLPVSSVAWGPWVGVGMTSRATATEAARATTGAESGFDPGAAAHLFQRVYAMAPGRYVALPQGWRSFARHLGEGPLPSLWRCDTEVSAEAGTTMPRPRVLLCDASTAVSGAMCEVLGYADAAAFDWTASFRDLGVDSLSAIKLRDHVGPATGLALSATVIFDYPSPDRLRAYLETRMSPQPPARSVPASPAIELDDADAEQALARELAELGMLDRTPG